MWRTDRERGVVGWGRRRSTVTAVRTRQKRGEKEDRLGKDKDIFKRFGAGPAIKSDVADTFRTRSGVPYPSYI